MRELSEIRVGGMAAKLFGAEERAQRERVGRGGDNTTHFGKRQDAASTGGCPVENCVGVNCQ